MNNSHLDSPNYILPRWTVGSSPNYKKKQKALKATKVVFKAIKLILYSFLFLMGLWGCFQTFIDSEVRTETFLGRGFEIGFSYGTTGDFRYDLQSDLNSQFYGFDLLRWNLQYGPFFAFFVYPGAYLVTSIMYPLKDTWGGLHVLLAIFVLLIIVRGLTFLISIRATLQGERMSEIQGKLGEINAKYKDVKKDLATRQKKQQELQELYKKYNIKQFALFEQAFVTVPIFLIVFRVVSSLRPIKVVSLFEVWNLSASPLTEITNNFSSGGWVYLFFLLIVVPAQFLSFKLPQILARKRSSSARAVSSAGGQQAKKMQTIQTVMALVFSFIIATSPSGIGMYWFLSSLFTIGQSFGIHKYTMNKRKKGKSIEEYLKYLGI